MSEYEALVFLGAHYAAIPAVLYICDGNREKFVKITRDINILIAKDFIEYGNDDHSSCSHTLNLINEFVDKNQEKYEKKVRDLMSVY